MIRIGSDALFCDTMGIDLPPEQRRLGYVPQQYALFPHLTVAQNVGFGIDKSCSTRDATVSDLLDDLGIAHLADRFPTALSGGEKQRVALARALAVKPRALLLDEPLAALDADARQRVRTLLSERLSSLDLPTLVVSHDVDDVEALGQRVAVLEGGRITQVGTLQELRSRPASPFVEHFLGRNEESRAVIAEERRSLFHSV